MIVGKEELVLEAKQHEEMIENLERVVEERCASTCAHHRNFMARLREVLRSTDCRRVCHTDTRVRGRSPTTHRIAHELEA